MSEKERFKPYAAAYLVLIKDGQVLLMKRANTGYQDGNYGLVSGHFDGGETAKQCIIREAKEEAGITVFPEDLKVTHVMHRYRPAREYFDIYLGTGKWSGEITNMEQDKCDELKWFKIDDLPENLIPEIKLALENIKNNIHYGEFGWAA
ncbi:MAG: NUDIX domain-containing protein [Candidatus Buchananbacteria bacterium]|jgi:8-oxo-dGTP pyrophosphatase MutT (NUDIX family)